MRAVYSLKEEAEQRGVDLSLNRYCEEKMQSLQAIVFSSKWFVWLALKAMQTQFIKGERGAKIS